MDMKTIGNFFCVEDPCYISPEMRVRLLSVRRALCQSPGTEDYKEGREYDEEELW